MPRKPQNLIKPVKLRDGTQLSITGFRVHNRGYYPERITEIRKISKSTYEGIANGYKFEIFGGRHAGGYSNEWYVSWEPNFKTINCKSFAECVRLIETC